MLNANSPGHVNALAGPIMENVKAQIDSPVTADADQFLYSLVLVMSKLASPWQLIRLATRSANSDDAKRIAETPYAVTVEIALEKRSTAESASLPPISRAAAASRLRPCSRRSTTHCADCVPRSMCRRSRHGAGNSARCAASLKILSAEVELVPGRVRRLIRPRSSREDCLRMTSSTLTR